MRSLLLSLSLMFLAAHPALSDEKLPLLKVGIFYYTNVTVTSVTETDIYFTHDNGMGNARLSRLSPELQQKFGYDAAKAAAAGKRQVETTRNSRKDVTPPAAQPIPANNARPTRLPEPAAPADIKVDRISAASFLGRKPPELVVEKWLTAQPDMKGKFVLVDFWATWCGPCRQSIPHLNELQAAFKDKLVVVGLSDENESTVRKMTSPKMEYAVAIDSKGTTSSAMKVRGIPHAIIMDPSGIVRFEGHPANLNKKNLAGLLAKYSNP